jgi:predicted secreted protein
MVDLLADADIGMAQIPCPEIACLGFNRQRPSGKSIRQALETPVSATCCQHLAEATGDRVQCYLDQGFEVLAVLGGNEQSPACAVHPIVVGGAQLTDRSGVFMQALAVDLANRRLRIPFRGIRDNSAVLLDEDLDWLRERIC